MKKKKKNINNVRVNSLGEGDEHYLLYVHLYLTYVLFRSIDC